MEDHLCSPSGIPLIPVIFSPFTLPVKVEMSQEESERRRCICQWPPFGSRALRGGRLVVRFSANVSHEVFTAIQSQVCRFDRHHHGR